MKERGQTNIVFGRKARQKAWWQSGKVLVAVGEEVAVQQRLRSYVDALHKFNADLLLFLLMKKIRFLKFLCRCCLQISQIRKML
jgi:hypothetical protein